MNTVLYTTVSTILFRDVSLNYLADQGWTDCDRASSDEEWEAK